MKPDCRYAWVRNRWRRLAVWLPGLLTAASGGGPAAADDIYLRQDAYRGVSVLDFDGEFLIFGDGRGKSVAKPLLDIESMSIDSVAGLDSFNRGELAWQQGRQREALTHYLQALPRTRAFWTPLVQARALLASDAVRALDQAVEMYIQLCRQIPDKAEIYQPQHIADAAPDQQRRALQLLNQALGTADAHAYWPMEALRLSIMEATGDQDAGRVAQELIGRLQDQDTNGRYRLQLVAIRIELKHRQYRVALDHINRAISSAEDRYLPELLFLKGRSLFELAKSRDDYLEAALAFMRVIIHFPKDQLCASSMYRVAQIYEKIDRPMQAAELYRACRDLPGATEELIESASAAAQRLQDNIN